MSQTTAENKSYPSPGYAWYTVILLTLAYIFSFIDRYILGLLIEPIKADLGLSDTQIGLLLGLAFAIFYVSMGIPLGILADRKRRTWIVAAGITIWSLATALSGLARNFAQLFVARLSIGVGEATLSPCALSIISDSFPKAKRARAIAVYLTALSLGSGIAYLVGGQVIAWSNSVSQIDLPLVGVVKPWQFTFIAVGLPGLIVAALMFFLREPTRKERAIKEGHASLLYTAKYVTRRRGAFFAVLAIASVMTTIAYSHTWSAPLFSRAWGWDNVTFSLYNGVILLAFGPATVFCAGWYTDRLYAKGRKDAPLVVMILGAWLMIPFGILFPIMPEVEIALVFYCINLIGIATVTTASPTALLNITPGEIRGQASAIYYMVISLTGLLLGPTGVAFLTDTVFADESMIDYSMATIAAVFGLPVMLLLPLFRKWYRRDQQEADDTESAGAIPENATVS